jgi:hypothetical protein
MPSLHHLALTMLLAIPDPAWALPPPFGFSLETAVSGAPGRASTHFTAVTSRWIAGDVEAEARLGLGSVDRTAGRGSDAVTPGLGLRWSPDAGRWRPVLGLEAGVRLPSTGPPVAPTAAARAGVEHVLRRELSLLAAVGWRWTSGACWRGEAVIGVAYRP